MASSVVLASYNGSLYIKEQVISILDCIEPHDELIIVDDASTDNTIEIIKSISDSRISLFQNTSNQGHVKTFEIGLTKATGDYIFLSDQDDLWPKNRVKYMIDVLEKEKASIIIGSLDTFGSEESLKILPNTGNLFITLFLLLIGNLNIYGSSMMFRRSILYKMLPFPKYVRSHDHWVLLAAMFSGDKITKVKNIVTLRRIHATNLTPTSSKITVAGIIYRFKIVYLIFVSLYRSF